MKSDDNKTYKTTDLYLSAFLYSSGVELLDLLHEGARGTFVFVDDAKCKELALAFYNGRGECDAREYARAVQELKSMVFNI